MKYATPIIIIGNRNNLRNPRLQDLENVANITYIPPIYLKLGRDFEAAVDQELAKIALGRPLLIGEVGCALAHKVATESAKAVLELSAIRGRRNSWCLILEDDAYGAPRTFHQILELLEFTGFDSPSLINFYSPRKPKPFQNLGEPATNNPSVIKRQLYWRGITSSYALNLKAARIINGNQPGQISFVADWPPNYHSTSFYFSKVSLNQIMGPSEIGERPKVPTVNRLKIHFRQLSNLSMLKESYQISRLALIKILIYYPIARDLINFLGARRRAWNPELSQS
jgi:hypothetical protein